MKEKCVSALVRECGSGTARAPDHSRNHALTH